MTTQDIINVLKEHNRQKGQITLQRAKDCSDFWSIYCSAVYFQFSSPLDGQLQDTLREFSEVDTLEVVNKKGRIFKRFANFWKEQRGEKLDDSTLGILGDILQRYLNGTEQTFTYDFTNVIDWEDGQFGKDDSCWWGCYSQSKDVFIDNGGWGIRFYENMDDDDGTGRTWIYPYRGMLLGFNSYGVSRPITSKVLKAIFADHGIKLHYKQASIKNSCHDDIPYINGDSGFVLYPDDINGDTVPDRYDLNMEVDSDDEHTEECYHCNRRINPDYDSYSIINGDIYCERCVQDNFAYCECCEEYYNQSDVHSTPNHLRYSYLCDDCAKNEGYVECYNCNEYVDEYTIDHDGDTFCESCSESNLTYCDYCEDHFYQNSHECPATYDFTGLIESQETLHAQLRIDGKMISDHDNVTVYRLQGITGLTLYNPHSVNSNLGDGWNISHDASGLAVKSDISFSAAKKVLIGIAELTDWNRTSDELQAESGLMTKIGETIRSILA